MTTEQLQAMTDSEIIEAIERAERTGYAAGFQKGVTKGAEATVTAMQQTREQRAEWRK